MTRQERKANGERRTSPQVTSPRWGSELDGWCGSRACKAGQDPRCRRVRSSSFAGEKPEAQRGAELLRITQLASEVGTLVNALVRASRCFYTY